MNRLALLKEVYEKPPVELLFCFEEAMNIVFFHYQ